MGGNEAVPPIGVEIDVDDRVGQTANARHDRDGAAGHGLHLGQAARFEAAGHTNEVAGRDDQMGQRFVVVGDHPDAIGPPVRSALGGVDEAGVSGAVHEVGRQGRQERQQLENEVDALLVDQPASSRSLTEPTDLDEGVQLG